jgi:hypothetical protein
MYPTRTPRFNNYRKVVTNRFYQASTIHSLRIPIRGFAFFSPEPETLRVPETGFSSRLDDEPEEYGWGVLEDELRIVRG